MAMGYRRLIAQAQQGERRPQLLVAPTFNPAGTGYDYSSAIQSGARPGADQHWPSRDPQTGQLLKGAAHDTFYKTVAGEKEAGYEIYRGADGNFYSKPRIPLRQR